MLTHGAVIDTASSPDVLLELATRDGGVPAVFTGRSVERGDSMGATWREVFVRSAGMLTNGREFGRYECFRLDWLKSLLVAADLYATSTLVCSSLISDAEALDLIRYLESELAPTVSETLSTRGRERFALRRQTSRILRSHALSTIRWAWLIGFLPDYIVIVMANNETDLLSLTNAAECRLRW